MADTIGDLVDKLTISNIRLWHIEDARREYCSNEKQNDKKSREFLNKVSMVNKERNELIDQINSAFKVLIDSSAGIKSHFKLTAEDLLGVGKNKFYKEEDRE